MIIIVKHFSKDACGNQGSPHSAQGIIIGTAAAGGSILIIVAVGIYFICFYKKKVVMTRGKFDAKGYPMTKSEYNNLFLMCLLIYLVSASPCN